MSNLLAIDYVTQKLCDDIDALLDDPHGVLQDRTPTEVMTYLQLQHYLCRWAGLKSLSDVIADRSGSKGYEFTRLMEIIAKARLGSGVTLHD